MTSTVSSVAASTAAAVAATANATCNARPRKVAIRGSYVDMAGPPPSEPGERAVIGRTLAAGSSSRSTALPTLFPAVMGAAAIHSPSLLSAIALLVGPFPLLLPLPLLALVSFLALLPFLLLLLAPFLEFLWTQRRVDNNMLHDGDVEQLMDEVNILGGVARVRVHVRKLSTRGGAPQGVR